MRLSVAEEFHQIIQHLHLKTSVITSYSIHYTKLYEVPKYLAQPDKSFLRDMVPWSEAFQRYEFRKKQTDEQLLQKLFPEPERPRTPRKRDSLIRSPLGAEKNISHSLVVQSNIFISFPSSIRFQGSLCSLQF